MERRTAGFTLLELLIVLVIISILAAIAIPQFLNTKEKSYVAAMRNDLRNLETAQEAYFSDYLQYTGSMTDLTGLFNTSPFVAIAFDSASATGWGATATHGRTSVVCNVAVSRTTAGNPICS